MELATAIRSAASRAPAEAIDGLESVTDQVEQLGALDTPLRAAHLVGQCAHESGGFARLVESLFYRSGDRIFAVFGRKYFNSIAHANQFAKNQQKLANRVKSPYKVRAGQVLEQWRRAERHGVSEAAFADWLEDQFATAIAKHAPDYPSSAER